MSKSTAWRALTPEQRAAVAAAHRPAGHPPMPATKRGLVYQEGGAGGAARPSERGEYLEWLELCAAFAPERASAQLAQEAAERSARRGQRALASAMQLLRPDQFGAEGIAREPTDSLLRRLRGLRAAWGPTRSWERARRTEIHLKKYECRRAPAPTVRLVFAPGDRHQHPHEFSGELQFVDGGTIWAFRARRRDSRVLRGFAAVILELLERGEGGRAMPLMGFSRWRCARWEDESMPGGGKNFEFAPQQVFELAQLRTSPEWREWHKAVRYFCATPLRAGAAGGRCVGSPRASRRSWA